MSAIIDYRGKSPVKTSTGIPLITAKIVKGGRVLEPQEFIAEADYDAWMRRGRVQRGDVVITTEAPLGEVAQLEDERVALAQRVILLRGAPGRLDNTFLRFALQSEFVRDQLFARQSGTTVLGIRQSELRRVLLPVPPLREQCVIAGALKAVDDKIALNLRTNRTLEATAAALFQSWFVDLDPVLAKAEQRRSLGVPITVYEAMPSRFMADAEGELPEGWTRAALGDVLSIAKVGVSPGDTPEQLFDHYSIPAFDEHALPARVPGALIRSGKFLVPAGAILVSKLNPSTPRVWWPALTVNERSVCSTEFMPCLAGRGVPQEFLHELLRSRVLTEPMEALVTGTSNSHQRVKSDDFLRLQIVRPSEPVMRGFAAVVGPLLERSRRNLIENATLSALRDALLPELLSGAIRLPQAEQAVATVA